MTQQQLISDLPDWVPAEAWAEYLKMRKQIKKPLTDYAAKLAIKKLAELAQAGQDPQAVLDQSILNSWQGLFAVRAEQSQQRQPMQTEGDRRREWADSITGRRQQSQVVDIMDAPVRRLK